MLAGAEKKGLAASATGNTYLCRVREVLGLHSELIGLVDKVLLYMAGSLAGLFFACQGIFGSKSWIAA
jgi:hypothetical protein